MVYHLLLVLQPQQALVWTCVLVFMATSLITLLGIIKKVQIDPGFLNKLFVALILEIVAIGVLAFKDSFKPAVVAEFVKIVSPNNGFIVGQSPKVFVVGAYNKTNDETIKAQLKTKNKTVLLTNNSKENGIFSTTIDSSLLDKTESFVYLVIEKSGKTVLADSIELKK